MVTIFRGRIVSTVWTAWPKWLRLDDSHYHTISINLHNIVCLMCSTVIPFGTQLSPDLSMVRLLGCTPLLHIASFGISHMQYCMTDLCYSYFFITQDWNLLSPDTYELIYHRPKLPQFCCVVYIIITKYGTVSVFLITTYKEWLAILHICIWE